MKICGPSADAENLYAKFPDGEADKEHGTKGDVPVENAHEPIIDQETFDKVQRMKGQIKHTTSMKPQL